MRYWQVLPIGPTGYGDSPYQSFSTFAGNPYLIDLQPLLENGLLRYEDLEPLRRLPEDRVDFGALWRLKWPILELAFRRFRKAGMAYLPNLGLLQDFETAHAPWLEPFAAFMALKAHHGGRPWMTWEPGLSSWERAQVHPLVHRLEPERAAQRFYQYLFFGQWAQMRAHALSREVGIIGDIPIFVAMDSADVWSQPHLYQIDRQGRPLSVAGVPPDYFSSTGQLWGNPLYRWSAHRKDGFAWWIERIRHLLTLVDVVRIDHFRGFWEYWEIPAEAADARAGRWRPGPRLPFFERLQASLPEARIIAEDLGDIDQEVRLFRHATGLPGMAILQFGFSLEPDNLYLPHNHLPNQVLYTGTHDNNTSRGWYEEASPEAQDQVRRYLRVSAEEISWDFVRAAYASPARLAIVPLQDLLSLDGKARFNTPGVPQGNWQWRVSAPALRRLEAESADYLRELAWLFDR